MVDIAYSRWHGVWKKVVLADESKDRAENELLVQQNYLGPLPFAATVLGDFPVRISHTRFPKKSPEREQAHPFCNLRVSGMRVTRVKERSEM